ncbi:MAG: hypothetical protein J7621_14170 [Niastella sp.]|nr:hypothetical protein [Niastella sp.]
MRIFHHYSRQLLSVLAGCVLCLQAMSQQVTHIEYFVDTDPGIGQGVAVPLTAGQQVTAGFQVPINTFTGGFHHVYIRAYVQPWQVMEDDILVTKGGWSLTHARTFYKEENLPSTATRPNIVAGEYYSDTDPGYGLGNAIPLTPGTDLAAQHFTFDVTSLTTGFHNLHLRFKDANGSWGHNVVRNFYKEEVQLDNSALPNIVRGEYYIDTDPGFGAGLPITVQPGANPGPVQFIANLTSLTEGFHHIGMRFLDAKGQWSHVINRSFYKEEFTGPDAIPNIVKVEYYIDADPGYGNGYNVPVDAAINITRLLFPIRTDNLPAGEHRLYVRARDANGKWSHTSTRTFMQETGDAQYISVGTIPDSAEAGSTVPIPFTVNGTYGANNTFTAQLSDAAGSFTTPVNIGALNGNTGGNISVTFPAGTTPGNSYRVRIIATAPADTSGASFTALVVKAPAGPVKQEQTITFPLISNKAYGDLPFVLKATASSGLPVTLTVESGPALISNDTHILTITGTGTVTIKASQTGNDTYKPATAIIRSFEVLKATQLITFDTIPGKTFGDAPFTLQAVSDAGLPVVFTIVSGQASVTNNTITLTGAGPVVIRATQGGNQHYAAAMYERTFCITPTKPAAVNGFTQSCRSSQTYSIAQPIPGAVYTWSLTGGGTLQAATGTSVTVNWTTTGTWKIIAKATAACTATASDSVVLEVAVADMPAPADVTNLFPVAGTVVSSLPILLSWKASGASQLYDVYVWPDGTAQPAQPLRKDLTAVGATINTAAELPGFAPGKKYNWKVVAKNACSQSAGNTQTFTISELPNLTLVDVQAPSTVFSGNTIDVAIQVRNDGRAATGMRQWTDLVYLSRDEVLSPGTDYLIGSAANTSALQIDEAYNTTIKALLPKELVGAWYLIVVTNARGELAEAATDNNSRYKAIQISLTPVPDLQVTSVITPLEAFSGQPINLTYTVTNKGDGEASTRYWNDYIYISPDPVFNKNTAVKVMDWGHSIQGWSNSGYGTLNPLKPDSAYTYTVSVKVPRKYLGTYYLFVETDSRDNVFEFSFENNNTNRGEAITIFLTPPPDFVIDQITAPATAGTQEVITVNYTVKNIGATAPGIEERTWVDGLYISKEPVFNPATAQRLQYTLPIIRVDKQECPPPPPPLWPESNNTIEIAGGSGSSGSPSSGSSARSIAYHNNSTGRGWVRPDNKASFTSYLTIPQPIIEYCNTQYAGNIQYYYEDSAGQRHLYPINCDTTFYPIMVVEEKYANQLNAVLPDLEAGTYYLHVYTDFTNSVFEYQQENNNTSTIRIDIVNPDLVLDSIEAPVTVNSGTLANISWRIKNTGAGKVYDKTRKDMIWLSQSPVYNPADMVRLDSLTHCTALSSDALSTKTKQVRIPNGLQGSYYLIIATDVEKKIYETNDDNNYKAIPISITLTDWPDLIVNKVTGNKDSISMGEEFVLEYEVKNEGLAAITGKPWYDHIYMSIDSVWNTSARQIATVLRTQELAAGASYIQTYSLQMGKGITGTVGSAPEYYFYIVTDGGGALYEHEREDNNRLRSSSLHVRNVDLATINVTAPATVESGKTIGVSWTVNNLGSTTGLFAESWTDGLYLSTDSLYSTDDIALGSQHIITTIGTGGSYSRTLQATVPNGLSGNYYLLVKADHNNSGREANTANNFNTLRNAQGKAIPITITLTPPPDLITDYLSIPEIGYAGQPVMIKFRVKNIGTGATIPAGWKESVYLTTQGMPENLQHLGGAWLGSHQHNGALAPGASYEDSLEVYLPINAAGNYYLVFVTDNPRVVYEHLNENNNAAQQQIFIIQPEPADLIVTDIVAPAQVATEDSVTITWKLRNQGINPASGYFREGIYLSADDKWDVDDVLLADHKDQAYITPLSAKDQSLRVKIKGVKDGKYFVIVRTDLVNNIYETDDNNNTTVSADTITVSMPLLTVNVPAQATLVKEAPLYYKLEVPAALAGETLLLSLQAGTQEIPNELYVRFNEVPSRSQYHYKYELANSASQEIVIPSLLEGTYYIMAYNGVMEMPVTLLAQKISFGVRSIATNEGGNRGIVTTLVRGAKFEPGMQVYLTNSSPGQINATQVQVVNSTTAFATFNLAGKATGQYNVVARKAGNDTTSLPGGFRIIAGIGGGFQGGGVTPGGFYCSIRNIGVDELLGSDVVSPAQVRVGQLFVMELNFGNSGNVDIPVPSRLLVAGVPIARTPEGLKEGKKELFLEFKELGGPAGILRPGATGSITIYTQGIAPGQQVYKLLE